MDSRRVFMTCWCILPYGADYHWFWQRERERESVVEPGIVRSCCVDLGTIMNGLFL